MGTTTMGVKLDDATRERIKTACSSELHAALPDSQKMVMPYGGHACNVTDPETFNALLLNGLASLLHHREAAL